MFRKEVTAAQSTPWIGSIRIQTSSSFGLVTSVSMIFAIAVLAVSMTMPYSRRTTAFGYLKPSDGLLNVVSLNAGVVLDVRVSDGSVVTRGQPLFTLDTDQVMVEGNVFQEMKLDIVARLKRLESEAQLTSQRSAIRISEQQNRLKSIALDIGIAEQELTLTRQRVDFARKSVNRQRQLAEEGFISEPGTQEKQEQLVDLELRERAAQRSILSLERGRSEAKIEIDSIQKQVAIELSQISEQKLKVASEIKQNDSKRTLVIVSPEAGRVSGLHIQTGDSVRSGQLAANILRFASGSASESKNTACLQSTLNATSVNSGCAWAAPTLKAEVYLPSRSIGFIRSGQPVRIKYDAYAQQKYGTFQGLVSTVSVVPVDPQNLPAGRRQKFFPPGSVEEPLYKVEVDLASQTLVIDERQRNLVPGMSVTVDFIQDRRTMIEWVFEPLLRLRRVAEI